MNFHGDIGQAEVDRPTHMRPLHMSRLAYRLAASIARLGTELGHVDGSCFTYQSYFARLYLFYGRASVPDVMTSCKEIAM